LVEKFGAGAGGNAVTIDAVSAGGRGEIGRGGHGTNLTHTCDSLMSGDLVTVSRRCNRVAQKDSPALPDRAQPFDQRIGGLDLRLARKNLLGKYAMHLRIT